jgi:hypothetical protein
MLASIQFWQSANTVWPPNLRKEIKFADPIHAPFSSIPFKGGVSNGEGSAESTGERLRASAALERLLAFPRYQDSTDPELYAAIRHAQQLADRVRRPKA